MNLDEVNGYALINRDAIPTDITGMTETALPLLCARQYDDDDMTPLMFQSKETAELYASEIMSDNDMPELIALPTRAIHGENIRVYLLTIMLITCEHCGHAITKMDRAEEHELEDANMTEARIDLTCPNCGHKQRFDYTQSHE